MEDTSETKNFLIERIVSTIIDLIILKIVLVPLAYIKFDEYLEELHAERQTLNKDLNKALKDIEKRPDNKKHKIKINLEQQLKANEQKLMKQHNFNRTR